MIQVTKHLRILRARWRMVRVGLAMRHYGAVRCAFFGRYL